MAMIRMLKGQGNQREFPLDVNPENELSQWIIGRDAQHCNLVLLPRTVSRTHARVYFKEGEFFIEDLESKAGTVLNGGTLTPHVPRRLKHRDLINICDHIFSFIDMDRAPDGGSSTEGIIIQEDEDTSQTSIVSSLESRIDSMTNRSDANAMGKLAAFIRLNQDLRNSVSLDALLDKALDSLLAMFANARRVVILLQGDQASILPRSVARFRRSDQRENVSLNRMLLENVMASGQAVSAADGMILCVPILNGREQPVGIIQLDADPFDGPFATDELDLLLTAAMQVSFAAENAMLYEAVMRERSLELELGFAHEMQISLLPSARPNIPGYEFWDYYAPAKQVGGDYFDYRLLRDDRLALLLGDVSGKGVPAALLMAKVSTEFSVFLTHDIPPVEVVSTVNKRFAQRSAENAFMTMVLVILDWKTHRLQLVNAGHLRPLLRRASGEVLEIGNDTSGLPLGIEPQFEYQVAEYDLRPGDTLLMVTDGVTEAENRQGDLYGWKRLIEKYRQCEGSAFDIVQSILSDTGRFIGDNDQKDDTCLVCVQRCL